MGWFRRLADYAREANDRDASLGSSRSDALRKASEQAKKNELNSRECCANCHWFTEVSGGRHYWCTKHDFKFDWNEANKSGIHYKKVCDNFSKKL